MDASGMKERALKRALAEAMALVDEADVAGMRGRRSVHAEPDADNMGGASDGDADNCPECAAGECVKHLSPEDAEGMASMYEG